MLTIILTLLFTIFAYLCGSIPTGVWFSKFFYRDDVRQHGSGNSGATNIGRTFGFKAAVIVSLIDVFKGFLPVALVQVLLPNSSWSFLFVSCAVVLGHAYPVFANFRGGKIVATTIGVLLAYRFLVGLAMSILFGTLLFLTSIVSVSSMVSVILVTVFINLLDPVTLHGITFTLLTLFLIYRHKDNIRRLMNGEERAIRWGIRFLKK